MRIARVTARPIPDTRGRPTVEVTLEAGGLRASASGPSGKSTGSREARELRDADGGVAGALANVTGEIASALSGRDFSSADDVDAFLIELDGTPDKSRLGANAILPVSIAAMRLFAQEEGVPLWRAVRNRGEANFGERFASLHLAHSPKFTSPRLFVNVMNGGVHADFKLPFQEYLLVIEGRTSEAVSTAREAFVKLGERLGSVSMGEEGGYAPSFDTLEEPFELLAELVKGFPGTSIAIDAAASQLYRDGSYRFLEKTYSAEELSRVYEDLVVRFPLTSIEDPFAEGASDDFIRLTATLGGRALIVGDDLTVTNPVRIKEAMERKEINAVLIKPNQIGTVREALQAVHETCHAGWEVIASHRSGETPDTFIADFAYGVGAYGIKAGGLGQKERLEKYERLFAIEREAEALVE